MRILDILRDMKILKSPAAVAVILVAVIILFDIIFLNAKTKQINEEADARIAAMEQQYSAALAAAQAAASTSVQTQPQGVSADAEMLAKVVAGCATYYDENVQRAVAWCVLNRVDSALYPDTIKEVCEQANQWQGYENAQIIDSIALMCQDVIDVWQSGGSRDIPKDCLFLRMTENGVELRTDFNGGNLWIVENKS